MHPSRQGLRLQRNPRQARKDVVQEAFCGNTGVLHHFHARFVRLTGQVQSPLVRISRAQETGHQATAVSGGNIFARTARSRQRTRTAARVAGHDGVHRIREHRSRKREAASVRRIWRSGRGTRGL